LRLLALAKHRSQIVHKIVLVVVLAHHSSSILVRIIVRLLVVWVVAVSTTVSLIVLSGLVVAILAVVRVLSAVALEIVAAEGQAHVTPQHEWHLLKDHLQVELKFFLLIKGGPLSSDGVLGAESLEILLVLELFVLHFANFTNLVVVNHKFAAAHVGATQLFAGSRRLIRLHIAHETVKFALFTRWVQLKVFNFAKRFEHVREFHLGYVLGEPFHKQVAPFFRVFEPDRFPNSLLFPFRLFEGFFDVELFALG